MLAQEEPHPMKPAMVRATRRVHPYRVERKQKNAVSDYLHSALKEDGKQHFLTVLLETLRLVRKNNDRSKP